MNDPIETTGDRMTVEHSGERGETTTIHLSDKGTGRRCGTCTLCCKLLPVPQLEKAANQRCKHQSTARGCAIYRTRPNPCRMFACRWLADPETAGLPRPDRAHYVIEILEDYVTVKSHDANEAPHRIPALVIWIDPAFPDAHQAPGLRRYIARLAERRGMMTLVRYDTRQALCIFPPATSSDREWHEFPPSSIRDTQHEPADIDVVLAQTARAPLPFTTAPEATE